MKGKLHKKGDHWVIRYKMEDDLIATDGGELSLHPEDTDEMLFCFQGREVDFEIVPHMHDTFVAKVIYGEPKVSDDFQIGPDGAYENVDEWDPDYMDGQNEDTWFDELDLPQNWKKQLKKFNLPSEVLNVICRLHYGETIALKQSMEDQINWIQKYHKLKKDIKNLLD